MGSARGEGEGERDEHSKNDHKKAENDAKEKDNDDESHGKRARDDQGPSDTAEPAAKKPEVKKLVVDREKVHRCSMHCIFSPVLGLRRACRPWPCLLRMLCARLVRCLCESSAKWGGTTGNASKFAYEPLGMQQTRTNSCRVTEYQHRGKEPKDELQIYTWWATCCRIGYHGLMDYNACPRRRRRDATLREISDLIKEVNANAMRREARLGFAYERRPICG